MVLLATLPMLAIASMPIAARAEQTDEQFTATIPYIDFDAGNHSYSLGLILEHAEAYQHGFQTVPLDKLANIKEQCSGFGNITVPATRDTTEILAASNWTSDGLDFIFTDAIVSNNTMQACILSVEDPSRGQQIKQVAEPESNETEHDIADADEQDVKYEVVVQSEESTEKAEVKEEAKNAAARAEVGLGYVGLAIVLAIVGTLVF